MQDLIFKLNDLEQKIELLRNEIITGYKKTDTLKEAVNVLITEIKTLNEDKSVNK